MPIVLSVLLFLPGLGLLIAWLALLLKRGKQARVVGLTLLGVVAASNLLGSLSKPDLALGILASWFLLVAVGFVVAWVACLVRRDRLARATGFSALGTFLLVFVIATVGVALQSPEERQALEQVRVQRAVEKQARQAQFAAQRELARQQKEAERLRQAAERAKEEEADRSAREQVVAQKTAEGQRRAQERAQTQAQQREVERLSRERAAAQRAAQDQAKQAEKARLAEEQAQAAAPEAVGERPPQAPPTSGTLSAEQNERAEQETLKMLGIKDPARFELHLREAAAEAKYYDLPQTVGWTAAQLIAKYGPPEETDRDYAEGSILPPEKQMYFYWNYAVELVNGRVTRVRYIPVPSVP